LGERSTGDGAAIAHAVLRHLADTLRCRTLFSTHYHMLADEHATHPAVRNFHMGCRVQTAAADGTAERVTFLYKLTRGACPKSYGVNVARLAGLPPSVLRTAAATAAAAARDAAGELRDEERAVLSELLAAVGGGGGAAAMAEALSPLHARANAL
jgi:DNA mismatch repair protein MSH6